jgi:hypothetical protein
MPLTHGFGNRKIRQEPPHQKVKRVKYADALARKPVQYVPVLKWDESEHPRQPSGSSAGGEFTAAGESAGAASDGKGSDKPLSASLSPSQRAMQVAFAQQSKKPVHKAATAEEAVALVLKGENVEIQDTKDVHTVLKKLGEMAITAASKKEKAPNFDPCTITVKGVSLFCTEKLKTEEFPHGIPRIEMPQFKTKTPTPGSEADKLPRKHGEVDATQIFLDHMEAVGVKTNPKGTMLARKLKASQAEMEGAKVAGMMLNAKFNPKASRITVSRDGYVVDGHHTWASAIGRDAEDGNLDNDVEMDVAIIDLPMSEIYQLAKTWTVKYGLPAQSVRKRDSSTIRCLSC